MHAGLLIFAAAMAIACGWTSPAAAQADLLSPDTLHGVVDLRAAATDGEPTFLDGGFGKARFGGHEGSDFVGALEVAQAALEWTPRLTWDLSAVVDVMAQPDQDHAVDFGQAYLVFKPVPSSATRFSLRAGYFYPPVSLENDARAWGVTNTITPSAINSWIGEEVKVVGAEANAQHEFGDQELGATVGLFEFDDTAGTLLALRGWALDDVQSQARGSFSLPPLSPFMSWVQADETYSTIDIDHRLGYYVRLEWQPTPGLQLNALYYDNDGNRTGVTSDLQWAWATHFDELGATWDPNDHTTILAQAMSGNTQFGYPTPDGLFVNMDFRSAYVLATRLVGKSAFTLRTDVFDNHDHSAPALEDTNEHGWAATAAWRYPLSKLLDVRLEALHIESTRPSRVFANEAPFQAQTVLQSSLRLTF